MIDEVFFSHHYTSFWNTLLPRGDALVRRMNLQHERFMEPLDSLAPASRRAWSNETAFRFFSFKTLSGGILPTEQATNILLEVQQYVEKLMRTKFTDSPDTIQLILQEAHSIESRISSYFKYRLRGSKYALSPRFPGCGILSSCLGDLMCGETLYEIKAGERNFRLIDVRQIIIYIALNKVSRLYPITNVCLFNPRIGISTEMRVDELIDLCSGRTTADISDEIFNFLSSEAVSN